MKTLRNMVDEALDAATIQKILPLVQKMEKRSLEDKNTVEAPLWKQLDTELQALQKQPATTAQPAQANAAAPAAQTAATNTAAAPAASMSTENVDEELTKVGKEFRNK